MANNETYTFPFQMFYFNTDNFKQKDALIILNTFNGGRLNQLVKFKSYGHISYKDWDTAHRYPTVEYIETFNRNKTNVMIFDTVECSDMYDKMFIYFTIGHDPSYGIVFYNTTTGKVCHKWYLDYEASALAIEIQKTFNSINFFKKINNIKKDIGYKPKNNTNITNSTEAHEKLKAFYEEKGLNIIM